MRERSLTSPGTGARRRLQSITNPCQIKTEMCWRSTRLVTGGVGYLKSNVTTSKDCFLSRLVFLPSLAFGSQKGWSCLPPSMGFCDRCSTISGFKLLLADGVCSLRDGQNWGKLKPKNPPQSQLEAARLSSPAFAKSMQQQTKPSSPPQSHP